MLARQGTRLIALRSAGFNHVDLAATDQLGLTVVRVPAYSPHAVAEHTIIVGRTESVRERFYAILVERGPKHPAVVAISEAAHQKVFG